MGCRCLPVRQVGAADEADSRILALPSDDLEPAFFELFVVIQHGNPLACSRSNAGIARIGQSLAHFADIPHGKRGRRLPRLDHGRRVIRAVVVHDNESDLKPFRNGASHDAVDRFAQQGTAFIRAQDDVQSHDESPMSPKLLPPSIRVTKTVVFAGGASTCWIGNSCIFCLNHGMERCISRSEGLVTCSFYFVVCSRLSDQTAHSLHHSGDGPGTVSHRESLRGSLPGRTSPAAPAGLPRT